MIELYDKLRLIFCNGNWNSTLNRFDLNNLTYIIYDDYNHDSLTYKYNKCRYADIKYYIKGNMNTRRGYFCNETTQVVYNLRICDLYRRYITDKTNCNNLPIYQLIIQNLKLNQVFYEKYSNKPVIEYPQKISILY